MFDAATFSRLDFAVVSRAVRGGNAVKVAAYNSSSRLDHDGKRYDFRRKRERIDGCVMLPDGAPESLRGAGALWRAVEESEKRVDAQLCRQVLISLPRELPAEHRLAALRAVAEPWRQAGMGCQIDLHCPTASDGAEQPHGHILLTLREVTAEGLARTKNRAWNSMFREGDGRVMRSEIDARLNGFFVDARLDLRVDNRSREARGLPHELPPEPIAPQQDWQQWLREGARPEARSITVTRVFEHRELRAVWERATACADAWQARAETLEAQAEAVRVANSAAVEAAIEVPARNETPKTAQPAELKIARPEPERKEATKMARRPATAARMESWRRGGSGYEGLTDAQRLAAEAAHDRWTQRGGKHSVEAYVEYVQDRQRRDEQAAAGEEQPDGIAPAQKQPEVDGIAPSSPTAAASSRMTHLERLLAERYQVPSALAQHVRRIEVDTDGRTAVLHTAHGRITDHGDKLTSEGTISSGLAAATVAAAAAKGWTAVRLTGSTSYREALARAAALHEPPLTTDFELTGKGRMEVQQQLRVRAAAAVPDMPVVAGMVPLDAARARLDHEQARAKAALAGELRGERDPRSIAGPRIAEAVARRQMAIEDAAEAQHAAQRHREAHGWTARLLDGGTRRRQAALDVEAGRTFAEARRLERSHDKATRRIQKDAEREAKQNERTHADWSWSKPVRQAQATIDRLAAVRAAVEADDPATITAAATTGSLHAALAAAEAHQQRQVEAEAEQERQRLAARSPQELKRDALTASLAAERDAAADPRRMEAARTVTAAVACGDTAAIAAAANGDMTAAAAAAKRWRAEEDRIAAEVREEQEDREMRQAFIARGNRLEFEPD